MTYVCAYVRTTLRPERYALWTDVRFDLIDHRTVDIKPNFINTSNYKLQFQFSQLAIDHTFVLVHVKRLKCKV